MLNSDLRAEFRKMAIGVLIMTAIMVAVFALIGKFSYKVITGALLGATVTIINHLFLTYSVVRIVEKEDAGNGKSFMKLSYLIRLAIIAATIIIAIKVPVFNYIAVAIPFLFPRIVIVAIHLIDSWKEKRK